MALLSADKQEKGTKPDSLTLLMTTTAGQSTSTAGLEAAAATGRRVTVSLAGVCDSGETQTQRPAWFLPALSAIGSPLGTEGFWGARPNGQRVGWLLSHPAAGPLPSRESQPWLTHLPSFVFSRLFQAHCTFSPLTGLARFLIPSRTVTIMADTGRGFFPEKDFRHHCAQTNLHLSCRVYFNFQWEEGANRYF